jgi:hypothetical protein
MHPAPLPESMRMPCPACARGAQVRIKKIPATAVRLRFILAFPVQSNQAIYPPPNYGARDYQEL